MYDYNSVKVGDHVVYHEPDGTARNAVVTANWGSCLNVVYTSGDTNRTDSYGRQIERATSVPHISDSGVHGMNWRWPNEQPNEFKPPIES